MPWADMNAAEFWILALPLVGLVFAALAALFEWRK